MKVAKLDPTEIIRAEAHAMAQCFGVPAPEEAAASLVERLQARLGGVIIYFPAGSSERRERVHEQIRKRCTGRNVNELAKEFGMTPRSVRRIVAGDKGGR